MKFKFINNDTFITVITRKVDNKSWNNPDSHFSSRVVDKISSCRVNTTSRGESNTEGFLLVLFFFYFPIKVARGHTHSSQGKSRPPVLNDSPEFLLYLLVKQRKNVSSDQGSLRALLHAPLRSKIKIYKIVPKSHPNTSIYFLYLIDLEQTDFFYVLCVVPGNTHSPLILHCVCSRGGVGWGNLLPLFHTAC